MAAAGDVLEGGFPMRYAVMVRFQIVDEPRDVSPEEVEAQFDRIYEALLAVDVEDPDMGGSLADTWVDVGMVVDAHSPEVAQCIGRRRIEAAIVQSGGILLEPHQEPKRPTHRPVFDLQSVGAQLASA
jgi:hypothetical protein